jgi:general secretion pathway protein B
MSSILKALQKLEQDKSSRKPDSLKIDAEILRNKPTRKTSLTVVTLAALLLFICGSGAMYIFMKRTTGTINKITATNNKVVQQEAPIVVVPTPASIPEQAVPIQPGQHQSAEQKMINIEAPYLNAVNLQRIQHSGNTNKQEERSTVTAPVPRPEPIQKSRSPRTETPVPILTVSGIAFQEGDAESIAVVNGVSVSRGAVVEGVTVTEILKDRVRFSYGAETIDVVLGKSNR